MTINQVDEGFLLDIESRVRIELDEYLFAYCDSADAERELRNRLPGLFGLEIVKINSNIAAEIDQIEQSDARTYIVRDHLGIPTQHHYEPRRLTDDEIRARGFDISDELLTHIVVFWSKLEPSHGPKEMIFTFRENRQPTLRDYHWRALYPIERIEHEVRFVSANPDAVHSFKAVPFLHRATVTRDLPQPNTMRVRIMSDTPIDIGHGWIATWVN